MLDAMTEKITKDEVVELIEMLRESCVGFHADARRAVGMWYSILCHYTRNEVLSAAKHIAQNTDNVPTHRGIKQVIDGRRKREKFSEMSAEGSRQIKAANDSFANVPGNNRAEQVIFITGECAAEQWRYGDRENDFLNSRLIDAKKHGFEFSGVDYSLVRVSPGYDSDWFTNIARQANSLPEGIY